MFNANRGYKGFSMSNRAAAAYESGEMPISKWTKQAMIERFEELDIDAEKINLLKKLPKKVLAATFLQKSSWHHTSSYFNATDFYEINESKIEEMTIEEIKALKDIKEEEKAPEESEKFFAKVEYLTWSGSRRHPKAEKHIIEKALVEIKGSFYIINDNGEIIKKKIGSNGTDITRL